MTDLTYHQKTGKWVYERLLDTLSEKKLPFWHVGDDLLAKFGTRDVKDFYASGGHPNHNGNRIMAEVVLDHMQKSHLLED